MFVDDDDDDDVMLISKSAVAQLNASELRLVTLAPRRWLAIDFEKLPPKTKF